MLSYCCVDRPRVHAACQPHLHSRPGAELTSCQCSCGNVLQNPVLATCRAWAKTTIFWFRSTPVSVCAYRCLAAMTCSRAWLGRWSASKHGWTTEAAARLGVWSRRTTRAGASSLTRVHRTCQESMCCNCVESASARAGPDHTAALSCGSELWLVGIWHDRLRHEHIPCPV